MSPGQTLDILLSVKLVSSISYRSNESMACSRPRITQWPLHK